jgi:hypothetical protein
LTKIEHSGEGVLEKRLQEEAATRKRNIQACVESIHLVSKEHRERKREEMREAAQIRKYNEQVARDAIESADGRKQKIKMDQKYYGDVYRRGMVCYCLLYCLRALYAIVAILSLKIAFQSGII